MSGSARSLIMIASSLKHGMAVLWIATTAHALHSRRAPNVSLAELICGAESLGPARWGLLVAVARSRARL